MRYQQSSGSFSLRSSFTGPPSSRGRQQQQQQQQQQPQQQSSRQRGRKASRRELDMDDLSNHSAEAIRVLAFEAPTKQPVSSSSYRRSSAAGGLLLGGLGTRTSPYHSTDPLQVWLNKLVVVPTAAAASPYAAFDAAFDAFDTADDQVSLLGMEDSLMYNEHEVVEDEEDHGDDGLLEDDEDEQDEEEDADTTDGLFWVHRARRRRRRPTSKQRTEDPEDDADDGSATLHLEDMMENPHKNSASAASSFQDSAATFAFHDSAATFAFHDSAATFAKADLRDLQPDDTGAGHVRPLAATMEEEEEEEEDDDSSSSSSNQDRAGIAAELETMFSLEDDEDDDDDSLEQEDNGDNEVHRSAAVVNHDDDDDSSLSLASIISDPTVHLIGNASNTSAEGGMDEEFYQRFLLQMGPHGVSSYTQRELQLSQYRPDMFPGWWRSASSLPNMHIDVTPNGQAQEPDEDSWNLNGDDDELQHRQQTSHGSTSQLRVHPCFWRKQSSLPLAAASAAEQDGVTSNNGAATTSSLNDDFFAQWLKGGNNANNSNPAYSSQQRAAGGLNKLDHSADWTATTMATTGSLSVENMAPASATPTSTMDAAPQRVVRKCSAGDDYDSTTNEHTTLAAETTNTAAARQHDVSIIEGADAAPQRVERKCSAGGQQALSNHVVPAAVVPQHGLVVGAGGRHHSAPDLLLAVPKCSLGASSASTQHPRRPQQATQGRSDSAPLCVVRKCSMGEKEQPSCKDMAPATTPAQVLLPIVSE